MRAIKVYCPPGVEPPLYAFIDALDGKLKAKLLWQIFRLRNLPACELKEPHFKHFSLERYSQMYELREKGKVLIRIVFTVQNEDIILLTSFIKRQPRDIPDVSERSEYADEILALYRAGILTGDERTRAFRPSDTITRAEAAAIISRVALPTTRIKIV